MLICLGLATQATTAFTTEHPRGEAAIPVFAHRPPQIQSSGDLHVYMKSHIRRIEELGIALMENFPDEFPVPEDYKKTLLAFLALHDQSKVNLTETFQKKHGIRGRPIIDQLYEVFGANARLLSRSKRAEFQSLIGKLNGIDDQVANDFFRDHKMLSPEGAPGKLARVFLEIEKLADMVDRTKSSYYMEEFGRFPTSPSKTMSGRKKELAAWLEGNYEQLTRNYSYERFRNSIAPLKAGPAPHGPVTSACAINYEKLIKSSLIP
jgi:hypothetical protein